MVLMWLKSCSRSDFFSKKRLVFEQNRISSLKFIQRKENRILSTLADTVADIASVSIKHNTVKMFHVCLIS